MKWEFLSTLWWGLNFELLKKTGARSTGPPAPPWSAARPHSAGITGGPPSTLTGPAGDAGGGSFWEMGEAAGNIDGLLLLVG